MATPKVALKSKRFSNGTIVYYLDYRVGSKRLRPKVGTKKRDAGLIRAKVESDILLGTYQINP